MTQMGLKVAGATGSAKLNVAFRSMIIYMKKIHNSDWLRAVQLNPKQEIAVGTRARRTSVFTQFRVLPNFERF